MHHITSQLQHTSKVDISEYLPYSLKADTRKKSGKGIWIWVEPYSSIPENWQTFLRINENTCLYTAPKCCWSCPVQPWGGRYQNTSPLWRQCEAELHQGVDPHSGQRCCDLSVTAAGRMDINEVWDVFVTAAHKMDVALGLNKCRGLRTKCLGKPGKSVLKRERH